jgi:hypothetical protein
MQSRVLVWSMSGDWRTSGENIRYSFLSNYLSQTLDIWHTAVTHDPIPLDSISGVELIHFLIIHLVKFSTLMANGKLFFVTSHPHDI